MEPIIPGWIIFMADTSGKLIEIAAAIACFCLIALFILILCFVMSEGASEYVDLGKKVCVVGLICAAIYVVIPAKQTIYLMLAAHYITPDNLSAFGGSIKEFIDYLLEGIAGIMQSGE